DINSTYPGAAECLDLTLEAGAQMSVGDDLWVYGLFVLNDNAVFTVFDNVEVRTGGDITIESGATLVPGDQYDQDDGELTMNGGTIVNTNNTSSADFYFDGGILNLNGGTFEWCERFEVESVATLTINGSDIELIGWGTGDDCDIYCYQDFAANSLLIRADVNCDINTTSTGIFSIANDVTLQPLATLDIYTPGNLTVNGTMYVQCDATGSASLIDNGGLTLVNPYEVLRYYPDNTWHLISSPITDGLAGLYTAMYLQSYDETGAAWSDIIPVTDPLIQVEGYALWVDAPWTVNFVGGLNTGNLSHPVTANNPYGWCLLGNPYPSGLDWDDVPAANPDINGAVYYLEAATGNFVSYNGGMGGGTRNVPPGQGFFVSAAVNGTFNVTDAMRTHYGQDVYYKNEFSQMLSLQVEGNDYTDAVYMRFDENATDGFDSQYDAYKLLSWFNSEAPQVYMKSGVDDLSINVLPETEMIPVSFTAGVSGTYSFSLTEVHDFGYVLIEDLFTGETQNLLDDNYNFMYNTGEEAGRFVLHFAPLSVDELNAGNVNIYAFNKDIYVNVPENTNGFVKIYDILGQEIASQPITMQLNRISMENRGYYVVKVVGDSRSVTQKVYID
ncbi:MAG: T9SS type A sorting domain-containing protein, partial [Bacteroidales bacterium]|nr:T9SS type A sorting domain-containing protein [Bacteroidales bacterium]